MEQSGEYAYPHEGTCDRCSEGGRVRLQDAKDGNSPYICERCDREFDACVQAVVDHIEAVQERCGSRLCQVEHVVESTKFGPIEDVDLPFLVRDVLDAYFAAELVQAEIRSSDTDGSRSPS